MPAYGGKTERKTCQTPDDNSPLPVSGPAGKADEPIPRKALFACSLFWGSPFAVGSHHLARQLAARGWQVAYVSFPITPAHLAAGAASFLSQRFAVYRRGGGYDLGGQLWHYVPGALAAPADAPGLRNRWLHQHWHSLTVPNLVAQVKQHGFGSVDLLYLDNPYQRFWLDAIAYRRSVYRIADDYRGARSVAAGFAEQERLAAAGADMVLYTATTLAPYVESLGPRASRHFPNGVDLSRFTTPLSPAPQVVDLIPAPRVVYVGAMDQWFDFELVAKLALAMPEVSFILAGPDRLARQRLRPAPNLHLLGVVDHDEIPALLAHCNAGIIPFAVEKYPGLVNSINPLKLYEYFAAGLPVVASDWQELRELQSPALLAATPQEFVASLRSVLRDPGQPGRYQAFAARFDWHRRTDELIEIAMEKEPTP